MEERPKRLVGFLSVDHQEKKSRIKRDKREIQGYGRGAH